MVNRYSSDWRLRHNYVCIPTDEGGKRKPRLLNDVVFKISESV